MQKNDKAILSGWKYHEDKHPVINQHFAYKDTNDGRQIMFEDRTFYNEKEVALLQDNGGLQSQTVHDVKRIFDGEIMQINKQSFL
jgi:hypothetical protein